MDFVKLVSAKQKAKKLTDKDVANLTGISEYTYYALKMYRIYLTKVAYFSLCSVLKLPILSNEEIEDILEENKNIVGHPESNMKIAAESVDPEYLEKIENELIKLKKTLDTVDIKNQLINKQYAEIEKLREDLSQQSKDITSQIKQAYSDGVKEGASKIENMRMANNQQMIDLVLSEYSEKIEKLEKALKLSEEEYTSLYKYVNGYIQNTSETSLSLKRFPKPLLLCKEELGLVITEDMVKDVMENYHVCGLSIEEIANSLNYRKENVEYIIFNYISTEDNGVVKYVKRPE